MKIGFLHQPNDPYTVTRIKYFISRGHKVYSILFPQKYKIQDEIKNLEVIKLPDIFLNRIFLLKRILYVWHVYKITKKYNIDILHVVNAESMILSLFSKSKKVIVENQGSDVLLTPKNYPWVKFLYRVLYKFVDGVIQDSIVAQNAGIKLGAPNRFNEVINIGIDFTIFNKKIKKGIARKKLKIGNEKFVFSSRGMKKLYNIDTIIKSIPLVKKTFHNVKFVFASNYGELSKESKDYVLNNDLESNVLFTGFLNHENEMPFYTMDADVIVSVPSSDSSPFSVYEAMATQTPVIVSDLPWVSDNFTPNKDLLVVEVKDDEKLSNKIIEILKHKEALDVNSAYNIVYERVNKDVENLKLENFYKTVLN